MSNSQDLLSKGLQKGFGGLTDKQTTNRGGFELTSSHYEDGDQIYHDEWVNGGGSELVKSVENSMVRVYVGNVISQEKLEELGISEDDIMGLLKSIILEHADQIRLDKDFSITVGDWHYDYRVTYKRKDPYIINGIEEIFYKNQSVFVHTFGMSPIIES